MSGRNFGRVVRTEPARNRPAESDRMRRTGLVPLTPGHKTVPEFLVHFRRGHVDLRLRQLGEPAVGLLGATSSKCTRMAVPGPNWTPANQVLRADTLEFRGNVAGTSFADL
jgi:hypothetical protein